MSAVVHAPAPVVPPPGTIEPPGAEQSALPVVHVCRIDESEQGDPRDESESGYFNDIAVISAAVASGEVAVSAATGSLFGGVRSALMSAYEFSKGCYDYDSRAAKVINKTIAPLLWYGCRHPSRGRRRTPVEDMDALLKLWVDVFVELSTAHDKDGQDRAEAKIDTMLTPLLTAPVKQLREFALRLLDELKADPRVPYMVWRSFEVWHEEIIGKAQDEDVKTLKTALAREIAEMVEQDITPDIKDAVVNALQWRSEDALNKIRQAVASGKRAGAKPRLRGRESCLFLEVEGTDDVCVML